MKISIYALYAKGRFEKARQHSILHPERIVGNSEAILGTALRIASRIGPEESACRETARLLITRSLTPFIGH
jgi:hypothetical protein